MLSILASREQLQLFTFAGYSNFQPPLVTNFIRETVATTHSPQAPLHTSAILWVFSGSCEGFRSHLGLNPIRAGHRTAKLVDLPLSYSPASRHKSR